MERQSKEELSSLVGLLSAEVEKDSVVSCYSFEITNKQTREVYHLTSKTRNMSIVLMDLYSKWKKDDNLNLFEMEMLYAHMGLTFPKLYDYQSAPVVEFK